MQDLQSSVERHKQVRDQLKMNILKYRRYYNRENYFRRGSQLIFKLRGTGRERISHKKNWAKKTRYSVQKA